MRFIVLLSGGMDSTTALAWAATQGDVVECVSVDYGQRHRRELASAEQVAAHYGVPLRVLDLSSFAAALGGNALTDASVDVPEGHYADESMRATVVPNRNATFLMAAAGVAAAVGADAVVTAVHAGDHPVYPDCRPEFITAADEAARLGTGGAVRVLAPFVNDSKTDVARIGADLDAPLHLSWSCYNGRDRHCGRCGTCVERAEAFRDAGLTDPTEYEETTE